MCSPLVTIHTNLYTIKAKDILAWFISSHMRKGYGVAYYTWSVYVPNDTSYSSIKLTQEPDGEIVLNIGGSDSWCFSNSSWRTRYYDPKRARRFFINQFANTIKDTIKYYISHVDTTKSASDMWNCKCVCPIDACKKHAYTYYKVGYVAMDATFGDLRAMYEAMLGRKRMLSHITENQKTNIIGHKRNLIETEFEINRRAELESLKTKEYDECTLLNMEYDNELQKFTKQLDAKYEPLKLAIREKYECKRRELIEITL